MAILVLATRNLHKVHEIQTILGALGADHKVVSLREFPDAPQVVEDAGTFAGNASKKASELAAWISSHPGSSRPFPSESPEVYVLADDSGLEVDALAGAPGVHSARFAALDQPSSGNTPDAANNAKLLRLLEATPASARTARFHCVLALTRISPQKPSGRESAPLEAPTCFQGTCEGRIGFQPKGKDGFGYDPLFVPNGQDRTLAELGEDFKNRLSHRAQALAQVVKHLR
jgi:XTP/dITP diphosphohydrolase